MLHDPRNQIGQGARYRCPICNAPISIKSTGRKRKYCSKACRDGAYRDRVFRVLGTTRYPPSARGQNPDFSPTKSKAQSADSSSPRSPVNAPIEVLGHQCLPWPNPVRGGRARLIANAIAVELTARWPRGGAR
jgi:hypothetical protein